jgi:hypothetical protein
VTFRNDMNGQAIRRDEADGNGSVGDPHEVWYRFAGKQIGFTGNNGAPDGEFANSPNGPFGQAGSNSPTYYTDFDLSLTSYGFASSRSVASTYTVEQGDTLESIAAMLWGDASLWYELAEANGLQGGETLTTGQTLIIPAGVVRSSYNASTFAPYDPGEVINPITPTSPKPPKQGGKGCGTLGTVVMVVIAVVIAVKLGPQFAKMFANAFGWTATATTTVKGAAAAAAIAKAGTAVATVTASVPSMTAAIAGGAAAGGLSSAASQAFGIVAGVQEKFSWSGLALAAIGGGVGSGLSASGIGGGGAGGAALRGALGSAITQGIGVATGLQQSFSWAGVAAAGVGAYVSGFVGDHLPDEVGDLNGLVAANTASGIANAATRSLIEGTDFRDNLLAALPDIIGSTIGEAMASAVSRSDGEASLEKSPPEGDGLFDDVQELLFGARGAAHRDRRYAPELQLTDEEYDASARWSTVEHSARVAKRTSTSSTGIQTQART